MLIDVNLIQNFYASNDGDVLSHYIEEVLSKLSKDKNIICIGYNKTALEEKIPSIIPVKQGCVKNTISAYENRLPLASSTVDFIFITHVLEYINTKTNQEKFLKEIHRILGTAGQAMFIFPNFFANLTLCHPILKNKTLAFLFKHRIKRNGFVINNTDNILTTYSDLIPGIISAITVSKKINKPANRTIASINFENYNKSNIPT